MDNHFTIDTMKAQVDHILNQHPTLNIHGMDLPSHERSRLHHSDLHIATLAVERHKLRTVDSLRAIYLITQWIAEHMQPTSETLLRSYWLKHKAEKEVGYITDGQFITAALLADYRFIVNGGISADIYCEFIR